MSLEHSSGRQTGPAETSKEADEPPDLLADYWFNLICEEIAAEYLDLTKRTLQVWRQKGGGPKFIRISSRCIRYRRIDLRTWAEDRLRTSTADPGPEAAAA
jgi:hypothetical protein|tara:strand:- start:1437 stop:1739 length:303 start_codon:yes stop_codon:yes gene_type:complete